MKKFLLIDDHYVVRSGIRGLLDELCKPCEIYKADNSEQSVALLKQYSFDLIMMDVQVPKSDMLGLMEFVHKISIGESACFFNESGKYISEKIFKKRC